MDKYLGLNALPVSRQVTILMEILIIIKEDLMYNIKKDKFFAEEEDFNAKKYVSGFKTEVVFMTVFNKVEKHSSPMDVIFVVYSGNGQIIKGEEIFDVKPGDIIDSPKNIPHALKNTGSEPMKVQLIKLI